MTHRSNAARARLTCAAILALGAAAAALQSRAATYPAMAPVAQYLMADRAAEIALARSAAPPAISNAATIMVLGPHGYETAAKGTNGFVCLVERAWMSPFDSAEFWNPKMRGPVCYNAAAVRSILPITLKRTALALAGQSKPQMLVSLKAAVAKRQLPTPEVGAMSYMMSGRQMLGDHNHAWRPHLMFYTPTAGAEAWGANVANSPVKLNTDQTEIPEAVTTFLIPVATWSDGAPADHGRAHGH